MNAIQIKSPSPILATHPVAKAVLSAVAARLRSDFDGAERCLRDALTALAKHPISGGIEAILVEKERLGLTW